MKTIKITIDSIGALGKGIAREQGKICFIPFVLPQEEVEAKILKEKKNFFEAIPVKITRSSEKRIQPPCPVFTECGGCQFQHIEYQTQLEIKQEVFQEQLSRIAKIEFSDEIKIKPSPKLFEYRHKVEYNLIYQDNKFHKALHHFFSHELIPVQSCHLVKPEIELLADQILAIINSIQEIQRLKLTRISILEIQDNYFSIILRGHHYDAKYIDQIKGSLEEGFQNNLKVDYTYQNDKGHKPSQGKRTTISLKNLPESKEGQLDSYQGGFTQINQPVFEQIIQYLQQQMGMIQEPQLLVDYYCGAGALTFPMADIFEEIIGVEYDRRLIQFANTKIKLNPKLQHIKMIQADLEKRIVVSSPKNMTILLDPPRRGLSEKIKTWIKKHQPAHIFYLSCDGASFSRDLKELKENYSIEKITLWDMFPQTHHLEVLGQLKLK